MDAGALPRLIDPFKHMLKSCVLKHIHQSTVSGLKAPQTAQTTFFTFSIARRLGPSWHPGLPLSPGSFNVFHSLSCSLHSSLDPSGLVARHDTCANKGSKGTGFDRPGWYSCRDRHVVTRTNATRLISVLLPALTKAFQSGRVFAPTEDQFHHLVSASKRQDT